MIQPVIYRPNPYIKCACKLRIRAKLGFGVFDAATPKPNAGCIKNQGAKVVPNPIIMAGRKVGLVNHSTPQIKSNK